MLDDIEFKSTVRNLMCNKSGSKCKDPFHLIINSLTNSPTKTPTFTSITYGNLERTVNFHPKEFFPSSKYRHQDVKANHVRSKHIKDLPYTEPRCCAFASNIFRDRKNARKLKKYNLIKSIRKFSSSLESEILQMCQSIVSMEEYEKMPITFVDETYVVPDSDSEEEIEVNFGIKEDAESIEEQCSACSTFDEVHTRKVKPREKIQEVSEKEIKTVDPCIEIVKKLRNKQKKVGEQKCCL